MCGRGFEPRFVFSWPTAKHRRDGRRAGRRHDGDRDARRRGAQGRAGRRGQARRADRRRSSTPSSASADAFYTSGLLLDDGVIDPRDTRRVLALALADLRRSGAAHTATRCSSASPGPEPRRTTRGDDHADHARTRRDPAHAEALHRRGDQSARRRMGGGRELPGAPGVQEPRRARPARPDQARGVRRRGARLLVLGGDGRGAGPRRLRRRADGDRRADRHVHAGAGPLRQRRAAPRVPGAGDRRRRGRLHRRLRARRRLRRREHQDHGAQGRRRLRHQRREDVDHQQPAGRLDVPARQHLRRRGAQEQEPDHGADEHARRRPRRRRSARSA